MSKIPPTSLSRSRAAPGHPLGNMENKRCRAVIPLSRGVTATPKKNASLEAVRSAQEGLTNAYKSITVPGHPRQPIDQKESGSGDPFEGGVAQTRRAIIACP